MPANDSPTLLSTFLHHFTKSRLKSTHESNTSVSDSATHTLSIQAALGTLRDIYAKEGSEAAMNAVNVEEELWKFYDDERLRMQYAAEDGENVLDELHTSHGTETMNDTIDAIQGRLEAYFSTEGSSASASLHHLLHDIQQIWMRYLPHYETRATQNNTTLSQHRSFQSAIAQREDEVDHLFLHLSHLLDQHLSEAVVRERWNQRKRRQNTSSLHDFLIKTQDRVHAILYLPETHSNIPTQESPPPPLPTDAHLHAFRPLFTQAFHRVQHRLQRRKHRCTKNTSILLEIVSDHYDLFLMEWSKLNNLRVVAFGEYHLVKYIYPHQLHTRLQEMPLCNATQLIYEVLREYLGLENDTHIHLAHLLSAHSHASQESDFQVHPGFARLFRVYLRGLMGQLFGDNDSNADITALIEKHFPQSSCSPSELYQMVVEEFHHLEHQKTEQYFKERYEKEFCLSVPRDVAAEAPEVVLQFLMESGQIEVEQMPAKDARTNDMRILRELVDQARHKGSLTVPKSTTTGTVSSSVATRSGIAGSKSSSQIPTPLSISQHKQRLSRLFQKLEAGISTM